MIKNVAASVLIAAVMFMVSVCLLLVSNETATASVKHCTTVVFAWRTPTGHEVDAPVTVCGTPIRKGTECLLDKPVQPGTVADCFVVKP